jgi:uncharacterized protein YoxC
MPFCRYGYSCRYRFHSNPKTKKRCSFLHVAKYQLSRSFAATESTVKYLHYRVKDLEEKCNILLERNNELEKNIQKDIQYAYDMLDRDIQNTKHYSRCGY